MGFANIDRGLDIDVLDAFDLREERVRRLGELARILTDSGQIFITTITDVDGHDIERLKTLNAPERDTGHRCGCDATIRTFMLTYKFPTTKDLPSAVERVCAYLREQEIISDYSI